MGRGYESAERIVRMARAAAGFGNRDRWITTDEGTHLKISNEGKVVAGPAGLEGRYLKERPKRGAQAKRDRKDKADAKRRFERGESVASIAKRHGVSDRHVRQVAERRQAKTRKGAEDNLRSIAAEVVGDNQEDQEGFVELVKDLHQEKTQGIAEYNQQLADFLGGDKRANQSLRGTIRLIQSRGGDATGVQGFDQVLDFAERYFPALLQVPGDPGHDAESALMHNIAQGKLPVPDLDDPEIVGEAIAYAESFKRSYQEKQEEDSDPIPFALMSLARRRSIRLAFDEPKFKRDKDGKFAKKKGPPKQNKAEKSSPKVIVLQGDEFNLSADNKQLRKEVYAFAKANLIGKKFPNDDTGKEIQVPMKGIEKAVSKLNDRRRALTIAKLPELLKHALFEKSEPPDSLPGHTSKGSNVKMFHVLRVSISVGGKMADGRIVIREDNNGDWFYSHDYQDQ